MSSFELMSELLQVVEVNGGADDASLCCGSRRNRVASVVDICYFLPLSRMSWFQFIQSGGFGEAQVLHSLDIKIKSPSGSARVRAVSN